MSESRRPFNRGLTFAFEGDAEGLVTLGELVAVDRAELVLQRCHGGEAVGDRVGIGKGVDIHLLD